MNQPNFQAFEAEALAQGYDEVVERKWTPGTVVDDHTHQFTIRALVVQGEMWLTVGDDVRHLQAGDEFTLADGEPHAERYGGDGATYWVARRLSGP